MNEINQKQKLPEGWKWVNGGTDIFLIPGTRPFGGATDEGIPSLGGEHITMDGRVRFNETNAKFVPFKFYNSIDRGKAKINDILINKDGANTGKVAILRKMFAPYIMVNEHVFIVRSKSFFDQNFLFYYLFSHYGQNQIKSKITGSAQPGLSSSFIKSFYLLFPTLSEQQKIAEILETVDNAREKTDAIIEKYKRIKKGLMQELLTKGIDENGKIRDEKTHRFKDSPLGRIPEEWEVKRLGEVISQIETGTWGDEIHTNYNNVFPIIRSTEIDEEGRFDLSTVAYRSLPYKKAIKYILNIGDILLVASSGSPDLIGRAAIIKSIPKDIKLLFSNFMLCIRSKNNIIISKFLFYILRSSLYCSFLSSFRETTTGLINFPKSEFENFEIPLPPLPEQQRIAEILSQIDEVIEKETQYRDKLKRLKAGLMEDLLTGKVRVNKLIKQGA